MGSILDAKLAAEMAEWESAGLRRTLEDRTVGRADFTSNDYLGLAGHPEVIEAARDALARFGAGGRSSRLLGGGCPLHEAAERAAAEWLGAETALLFPSGYQANLGLVTALAGRGDAIFSDRLNHASLIDAARLSRARVHVYRHFDLSELDRLLGYAGATHRRLVVTEGVFSMDGDLAPLAELHELCERHDAWLVLDEAHAAGLVGPEGAGSWSALGRGPSESQRVLGRVVTGGKALGAGGALVATSRIVREHLVNHARPFVYTTAPSPAVAGALVRAIELCRRADADRSRALGHACTLAEELGLPKPDAAIVPILLGEAARAREVGEDLRRKGFDVRAVRPPTVPEGTARLRLVCHATNTGAEVEELGRLLGEIELLPSLAPSTPGEIGRDGARLQEEGPRLGPALFVVGTDTGIGKTIVSALLLRAARAGGEARYWKAVQTGPEDDTGTVAALAEARPHELLPPAWKLPLPASPHEAAAAAGVAIEPERLAQALDSLRRLVPEARIIVELAGGLLVPYREGCTQADWLERASPSLVLVARSGLGTLNHTLLTLEALRARHLEPEALFLVGEPHASNLETLRRMGGVDRIYELPPLELLDPAALDRWLEQNDLSPLFPA